MLAFPGFIFSFPTGMLKQTPLLWITSSSSGVGGLGGGVVKTVDNVEISPFSKKGIPTLFGEVLSYATRGPLITPKRRLNKVGKPTDINIRGLRGDKRAAELTGLDLSRVLILAIDTARDLPKALICDYFGRVLEKPFFFAVNSDGIFTLHKKIQHWVSCVKALRVFVGIEVAGCYHDAIGETLNKLGYDVNLVNSFTTASERKKMLDFSKTDDKDLLAIAQAIIANNGLSPKRVTGFYEQMQAICRTRRQLVTEASALKAQVRQLMSMVFREFQGMIDLGTLTKQKVFASFWSPKSRLIMRHCPSPHQILSLGETGLKKLAISQNIKLTEHEIETLLQAAQRDLLTSPADLAQFKSEQVKFRLEQLETLEKQIIALEFKMEQLLVESPALLLLSIKGINVITATEFIAEIGSIFNYTCNRQLVKLSGINPVLSQSGGKKARAFQISRQGNPALRYVVTLIGKNLCSKKCWNSYFIDYYERLQKRGKSPNQIYVAAGNKFLRIAFAMLRNQTLFHIPGYEECTSDIIGKLSCKETKETARQALSLLTANKKQQLLCS